MLPVVIEMLKLLMFDLIVVAIFLAAVIPLSKYRPAASAVLKRNFLAYFSNPTGYVFLCLFVLLTSLAAFWPHDFFQSNLANLDQLNSFLPLIMLVFIAAITMSIWAEERRQGTDELLLTIPASDYDIVLGKYLAAVAIFSASLLFSQITNFAVLNALTLGDIDSGLFVSTYIGYWMIGLAMLAIGMVASFLTSNLTIGFILGVLFNLPLVVAMWADTIIPSTNGWAMSVAQWSYFVQSEDFGRGVISLRSVVYFFMLVAIGVYLCIVLIGRRHWLGGRDGSSLLGHYFCRFVALILIAMSSSILLANFNRFRWDTTDEKLSSLSPNTKKLMKDLKSEHPIHVEAFISRSLPEMYVKTKNDMIAMLTELKAVGGTDLNISIHDDLEPSSDDAARAEQRYDIKPVTVLSRSRGAFRQEDIFMGAVFRCGLDKVVLPFVDRGIPVEYELVRSICTVAQEERKKIGVIKTDANCFGGFSMGGGMPRQIPKQLIIEELEKQYNVVEIDPTSPIVETVNALLVVQPSSLTPPQMDNLIEAIERGVPTALFEDPFPVAFSSQPPGTNDPRRPQGGGGMFGGQQPPPEPKGDIAKLWSTLGITMVGEDRVTGEGRDAHVIWQNYNPYPKTRSFRHFTKQFVFVGPDAPGTEDALTAAMPITSGLQQLLFLYPGGILEQKNAPDLSFVPLASCGNESGYIRTADLQGPQADPSMMRFVEKYTQKRYVLAASIKSETDGDEDTDASSEEEEGEETSTADDSSADAEDAPAGADAEDSEDGGQEAKPSINVVYVADIDCLSSAFLELRARPDEEVEFRFDNVTFVLNILDTLADDDRYVEIRKRQTRHSTLKTIELLTEDARAEAEEEIDKYEKEFENLEAEAKENMEVALQELEKELDEIKERQREQGASSKDIEAAEIRLAIRRQTEQRRLDTRVQKSKNERDQKLKEIDRQLELKTQKVQNTFKVWAAVLPPLPPLLIGFIVFVYRRLREREGVSRERLR
ncbi:MAG: Gldg family protein [Pirellulaceae bacterium]|nr:Gldg family protein [Pirellulaceae bacterium]